MGLLHVEICKGTKIVKQTYWRGKIQYFRQKCGEVEAERSAEIEYEVHILHSCTPLYSMVLGTMEDSTVQSQNLNNPTSLCMCGCMDRVQ